MKANELRIGNLVADYDCSPYYFAVEQITKTTDGDFRIHYRNNSITVIVSDIPPMPLNAESLEKFGIEVMDDNPKQKEQYKGDVIFRIGMLEFSNSEKGQNGGFYSWSINDGNTIFKYVHQFQNWYFSHFGEELEIKKLINSTEKY